MNWLTCGRKDDWTNLIQKILGALLFFHPAVWWIEKKLALEREMACDDLVLAQTTSPRAYAECLVSLAEKSFLRRGLALAQAAVDRVRNVSLRVTRILDVNRPQATRVWGPAPILVGGVSLACLMALSIRPRSWSPSGTAELRSSAANSITTGDFEASQMSSLGAHVVPARLQVRAIEAGKKKRKSAAPLVAKSAVKRTLQPQSQPDVIPARTAQRRTKGPSVIQASIPDSAAQPMFLVIRTELVQTQAIRRFRRTRMGPVCVAGHSDRPGAEQSGCGNSGEVYLSFFIINN